MPWTIELRGGDYDGGHACCAGVPDPLIIVWRDGETERASADPAHPAIVLATAQAYRRVELLSETRHAIYEVGDVEPSAEEEVDALVAAGAALEGAAASLGDGWPVAPMEDPLAPARGLFNGAVATVVVWMLCALPFVVGSTSGAL